MVVILAAALLGAVVACSLWWGSARIVAALEAARGDAARARLLELLETFGPAVSAVAADPRAALTWEPLARTARQLFPEEFGQLDRASGGGFPLGPARIQAAHDQWTVEWLAWERAHDIEFKLKTAAAEEELLSSEQSPVLRARLDVIESQKLDLYQHRYQDYIRTAKALQALSS